MKINDEITKSVAETVAELLEKNKIKTETEVQKANKDFVDLHAVDDKEDPEQKKQVESKDEVEEGNEFTKAAAKAKLAGKDEFDFEGKTYPVEIEQDAAEKILGKKESVELEEATAYSEIEKVYKWAKKYMRASKGKNYPDVTVNTQFKDSIYVFLNMSTYDIIAILLGGKKGILVRHDTRKREKGSDFKRKEYEFSSAKDVIKFAKKEYDSMPKDESVEESANLEEAALMQHFGFVGPANLEEAVDNFFGFPTKDKLVKFQSMAKKLKIKSISNPTVLKRGGKEFHVMGFEGSVSDIEKAMRVADGIIKESAELEEMFNRLKPDDVRDAYGTIELKYRSSADIRDAEDKLKKAGINVRKNRDTLEVDSDSPAFKKAKITSTFDSSKREKAVLKVLGESVELEEGILGKIKDKLNPKKAKAREELTKLAKAQKNLKGVLDKIQAKADKEEDGDKAQEILDKGDKLWLKLDDIESKMAAIRKKFKGIQVVKESVELQEAANFGDIEKVMKWAKKNIVGGGKFPQLDISKKYGTAFINLTIFNIITLRLGGKKGIVVTHDDRTNGKGNAKEEHFSNANEVIKFVEKKYNEMPKKESIEEAVKPADFVKGGDTKITKREVDGMLSKLFIDAKLAKAVEASSAFKAGEKSNGKKNPYNKDTADFHLFILGQQSADAE